MKRSIISPVYGAASLLHELVKEIEEAALRLTDDYEIILVEDHRPDESQTIIREICKNNPHVIGAFHSRNFGQQYAIHTGFTLASGDYVVTMDCDMQDTPSLIVDLYNKLQEGYDLVFASRQDRQDGYLKVLGSKMFNRLLGFKSCKLPIPHAERSDGKASSYSMKKRIMQSLNTAVA